MTGSAEARTAPARETPPQGQAARGLVEEHWLAGREVRFTIATTSMWPALQRGDEVLVRRASADSVRPGDILFMRSGDAWLAHRLIVLGPGGLVTKGDNATRPDAPLPSAILRGVVSAVRRAGREARLDSASARRAGEFLAWLSRAQAEAGQGLAARALGLALRLAAGGLRRASGL